MLAKVKLKGEGHRLVLSEIQFVVREVPGFDRSERIPLFIDGWEHSQVVNVYFRGNEPYVKVEEVAGIGG